MANYKNRIAYRKADFVKNMRANFPNLNNRSLLDTLDRMNTTLYNFSENEKAHRVFSIADTARSRDFSSGVNDSANLNPCDITDITMISTFKSLIPALALDKGLTKPKDIITYAELVAAHDFPTSTIEGDTAKLNAGDKVVSPFEPMSPTLNLSVSGVGLTKEVAAAGEVEFAMPIAKKRIYIEAINPTDPEKPLIGQDLMADGNIYWVGKSDSIPEITVDYNTGKVTVAGALPAGGVKVTCYPDTTSQESGSHTLKTKRHMTDTVIEAETNRVIFEDSIEDLARMNKMLIGSNFGKTALKQLLNAFIYTLNNQVVSVVYNEAVERVGADIPTFDLTTYTLASSQAYTKDDKLQTFILRLNQTIQDQSNFEGNTLLVGSAGATILKSCKAFVCDPSATKTIDGYIGKFMDIPVYRSQYVSYMERAEVDGLYAHIVMLHRAADGSIAPAIYGEYIPIYASERGINFYNPSQFSQVLFNQSKSIAVVPNLCTIAKIKYSIDPVL